ncbi:hypothetical protein ETW23_17290 [Leisingera sp. NJS201]|nr:hypothetical protein [Leisingera sp. NJS201]QBR37612.1 hypothetical protein ETW23_17290 [Leisingera sp. NJS201]
MGLIGRVIGHGEEKKGNIAFIALILAVLLLLGCIGALLNVDDKSDTQVLTGMITPVFGIITGVIGFITGTKN